MTITYQPKSYFQAVRNQFAGVMAPEQFRKVMRTAAKRMARHHGQISKYDGQGRIREGFPSAGDTGGRPVLPYTLMTSSDVQARTIKRRQSNNGPKSGRSNRANVHLLRLKSSGPSRKMFVDRTDGGYGDYHV